MISVGARQHNSSSKVYVGSLPGDATEAQVYSYFSQFGALEEVVMFYQPHQPHGPKRLNRGFCHLLMADSVSAQRIIDLEHTFYGRTIICSEFKSGSQLK